MFYGNTVSQSVRPSTRPPSHTKTRKRKGAVRREGKNKTSDQKEKKLNETLLQGLMMT